MRLPQDLRWLVVIGFSSLLGSDASNPPGTLGSSEDPTEKVSCCMAAVPHIQPFNVAANAQKLLLQSSVQPKYPADSCGTGKILLQVVINEEGAVHSVRFLRCPPSLREAVKAAVCQWHYKPNFLDMREPVPVLTIVEIAYDFGRYRI